MRGLRCIQVYYLSSPFFLLAGVWWGWEVRATFLPDPGRRFLYYALLGVLGLLTHFRPASAPWVALGESTLNLTLVMAWIVLPIYAIPDAALEQGVVSVPYTPAQVLLNGGLAGAFFLLGFYQAQNVILVRFPWLGGPRRGGPRTS